MKLLKLFIILSMFFLLAPSQAEAACTGGPTFFSCSNEGEAYAVVNAYVCPTTTPDYDDPVDKPTPTQWRKRCNSGLSTTVVAQFPSGTTCSTRTPSNWPYQQGIPNGSYICIEGCQYVYASSGTPPTAAASVAPTGSLCTPYGNGGTCPSGTTNDPGLGGFCVPPNPDRDGDGVPNETDAFPDDPDESSDRDGDGVGDNADSAPDDPTNGADEDEEGGDEGDNQSAGGGNCKAPPVSSGDAILTQIAYQAWATRCAAEKLGGTVTGDPTNCASTYQCTGDQIQCAQVAVMRKNACANAQTNDDLNGNGQPDWTEISDGGIGTDGDPSGTPNSSLPIGLEAIDTGGLLSNRSCPQLGTVELGVFGSYSLDGYSWTCDILNIVRYLIIMMAAYTALKILMGDNNA